MIDPFNAHDDEPRWLCWRQEIRADKPTKVPYSARTGRYASATDPLTWSNRLTAEGYIFQNLKLSSETLRPQSSAAPAHAHPCRAGHCTGKLDLVHKSLLLAALRRKFRDSFARGGISKISDRRRDGIAQSIFYVCVSRKPARMGLAMPRRPKPVDLHHLEGTYQRVRHDRRAVEPEAPADLAELRAPKWLTERQRAIWADVVKRAPRGILRAIDRELVAAYCELVDRHQRAAEAQARLDAGEGLPLLVPGAAGLMQSPYLRVMSQAVLLMVRIQSELGFSPAGRAGLGSPKSPATDKDNTWSVLRRFPVIRRRQSVRAASET